MNRLTGLGVAMITPFKSDLSIDFQSLSRLIEHISQGKADYLVVMGTTGENPTLSWSEQISVLEFVLDHNSANLPIVFGNGGNNTQQVIDRLKDLNQYPIDAYLTVSPYYNRPSQEGIFQHYHKIGDQATKPVILYDVPARTALEIDVETVLRLAEHPNIIGIKDSVGKPERIQLLIDKKPTDFHIISGDDSTALDVISKGGIGLISVLANLLPFEVSELTHKALDGHQEANEWDLRLKPFYSMILQEGNPSSIKAGLDQFGISEKWTRLPLTPPSDELKEKFRVEIEQIKKGA